MKISLVTPAGKQSRAGNRTTAVRWGRILRTLGHKVAISETDDDPSADMMVAVHAWRSASSIRAFSERFPDRPLVVLLAGTDIYSFQKSHPEETRDSMKRASALVCLHDLVWKSIPKRFHDKLNIIYQSSLPLPQPRKPAARRFEVCVIGHLRDEKDSLRTASAARLMPEDSRLHVVHLGKAHNAEWEKDALQEAAKNPRFDWRGEVAGWQVRRQFARSHAMVISSVMEGGANVVSEAIVAGLPVIASDIDGNIGLLGDDYGGYFRTGDTKSLAETLYRAETDPTFLKMLERQIKPKQKLFTPERELRSWKKLLMEIS